MPERKNPAGAMDDVDAVTRAVLTASRLLVAVSARSLAEVEERVTVPQFRMLVVLSTRGDTKLVTLADLLQVAPSTAMRMVDRLIAAGLAERRLNPANRRETQLGLTEEGVVRSRTSWPGGGPGSRGWWRAWPRRGGPNSSTRSRRSARRAASPRPRRRTRRGPTPSAGRTPCSCDAAVHGGRDPRFRPFQPGRAWGLG